MATSLHWFLVIIDQPGNLLLSKKDGKKKAVPNNKSSRTESSDEDSSSQPVHEVEDMGQVTYFTIRTLLMHFIV